MNSIKLCMAFLLCFYASILNADEIYIWTDEKGVTHFSNIRAADKPQNFPLEETEGKKLKKEVKPKERIKRNADIIKTMYFKSGRAIEYDIVWEGMGSEILCKKSNNIIAYSAGDVDLIRTFGEIRGKEIAERYEERVKDRELMSRPTIVTPEQERNMHRAEGEQLERVKKYKKQYKGLIELEKRLLKDKLKRFKEKYRTASGPPPKGRMGFNEREFYKRKIEGIEKKIEELEKDPEYYFYGKNQQSAERSKRVKHPNTGKFGSDGSFYAPIGDGGLLNLKTGEIIF